MVITYEVKEPTVPQGFPGCFARCCVMTGNAAPAPNQDD